MSRKNCWEILECGKEQSCPAYPDHGRDCFAVAGTMCRGAMQGAYDEKISMCRQECGFFKGVMDSSV
jgi:hypothetical protein